MIKFITEPKNLVTSRVITTTKKLTEAQRAAKNLASKRYRINLTPEQQKRYSLQKQQYYKTPAGAVALQQTKARYFAKMTSEQYAAKNYTNVRYRARLKEQSPYAGMSKFMRKPGQNAGRCSKMNVNKKLVMIKIKFGMKKIACGGLAVIYHRGPRIIYQRK